MTVPGSSNIFQCWTARKVRKCSTFSEINLLFRKLDWLFPFLPLVIRKVIDQVITLEGCYHTHLSVWNRWLPGIPLIPNHSAWSLCQDWAGSILSAFRHRLDFYFWQCFALLCVASSLSCSLQKHDAHWCLHPHQCQIIILSLHTQLMALQSGAFSIFPLQRMDPFCSDWSALPWFALLAC